MNAINRFKRTPVSGIALAIATLVTGTGLITSVGSVAHAADRNDPPARAAEFAQFRLARNAGAEQREVERLIAEGQGRLPERGFAPRQFGVAQHQQPAHVEQLSQAELQQLRAMVLGEDEPAADQLRELNLRRNAQALDPQSPVERRVHRDAVDVGAEEAAAQHAIEAEDVHSSDSETESNSSSDGHFYPSDSDLEEDWE